jgi:hypothetical protein
MVRVHHTLLGLAYLVMACLPAAPALAQGALPPVSQWSVYTNDRFGFRLVYPDRWFASQSESEDGDGSTFVSRDGRARLVVFGAHNAEGLSPQDYRTTLLDAFGGYDELTYSPVGRTWFVLSGYRGDDIYYQKVMFSCAGQIINVLSIRFPTSEKPVYAPIIEAIEDRFRPGMGLETPRGCR